MTNTTMKVAPQSGIDDDISPSPIHRFDAGAVHPIFGNGFYLIGNEPVFGALEITALQFKTLLQ